LRLVIGAPAWDRAWSLPLWFESVRANVNPAETGLVFVVPPNDSPTRDAIADLSSGFDWVEVLRDPGAPSNRQDRPGTGHRNLADARNRILKVVERVRPDRYLSWDTDFLAPPGAVDRVDRYGLSLATVWGWLNRQEPRRLRYRDSGNRWADVLVQDPGCFTAMGWARGGPRHFSSEEYLERGFGLWRAPIALAWQLMDQRAYRVASYSPHPSGEDVPFNRQLAARGVERWCVGGVHGVHLYDRTRRDEIALGWPGVMRLADQAPLAATFEGERPLEYRALGLFPAEDEQMEKAA
jgi:hypothetical protein